MSNKEIKRLGLRIPAYLKTEIDTAAGEKCKSVNRWAISAFKEKLQRETKSSTNKKSNNA